MMRDLEEYPGYQINESGIIINKKGHVMRTARSNSGYLRVAFDDPIPGNPKHRKNDSIHRLVAKTFLENPDPLKYNVVMHKDNDQLNNHVSNLQWGTQSENVQQAFNEGRRLSPAKINKYLNVYEVRNDKTGDIIRCNGRSAVAELIQYEEISLKNMVGNDREIALGPYTGYKIFRTSEKIKIKKPFTFVDKNIPGNYDKDIRDKYYYNHY